MSEPNLKNAKREKKGKQVFVVLVGQDSDASVLRGRLLTTEIDLLVKLVGTGPSDRQYEVALHTPAGKVLRRIYKYTQDSVAKYGVYEDPFSIQPEFSKSSLESMALERGRTIIWYGVE